MIDYRLEYKNKDRLEYKYKTFFLYLIAFLLFLFVPCFLYSAAKAICHIDAFCVKRIYAMYCIYAQGGKNHPGAL